MKFSYLCICSFFIITATSYNATAQTKISADSAARYYASYIKRQFSLTDEQVVSFIALQNLQKRQIDSIRIKAKTAEASKELLHTIIVDTEKQLATLLTKEQWNKYQAVQQQRRESFAREMEKRRTPPKAQR